MARIVVKRCVSSALKIWTMFRSPKDSNTLNTYVPAGRICTSTPGTSKGALNVITVFLSKVSALTFAANARATRAKEHSSATTLNGFIFELPLVNRFIARLFFRFYKFDRHTEIGALQQRGRRCFGPTHCSSLGRSAFDQILAGRRSCDVYSVLIIIGLFNTAHG